MPAPQTGPATISGYLLPPWWLATERPAPAKQFGKGEISLAEILNEPITQALMRADNVSWLDLTALCERVRCTLGFQRSH